MECGECTLCCILPVVPELDKAEYVKCRHCSVGCLIYEDRPQSCKDFECAYRQASVANVSLRPDKCGVIFEKIADDLMLGIMEKNRTVFPHLQGQVSSFLKEGINVVLSGKSTPIVYHIDEVQPEDMLKKITEQQEHHNGRSSI